MISCVSWGVMPKPKARACLASRSTWLRCAWLWHPTIEATETRATFPETALDGDGDTDVLSASTGDDKVAWYENTSPPPPIPTGSEWGLSAMKLLVLTSGTLVPAHRHRVSRVTG